MLSLRCNRVARINVLRCVLTTEFPGILDVCLFPRCFLYVVDSVASDFGKVHIDRFPVAVSS